MKKIICLIALALAFVGVPCFAAPGGHHGGGHGGHHGGGMRGPGGHGGGRPAMHGHVSHGHRPPMHMGGGHRPPHHHVGHHHRPLPPPIYRPYIRPYYPYYYSSVYPYYTSYSYYPATTYVYDPIVTTPVSTAVNGVVVTDPYLKVNTAANVINAAANVATMVRYWTWWWLYKMRKLNFYVKSHLFRWDFQCFAKEKFLLVDIENIDMENESFSYLLPKSGSRSFWNGFFLCLKFIIIKNSEFFYSEFLNYIFTIYP